MKKVLLFSFFIMLCIIAWIFNVPKDPLLSPVITPTSIPNGYYNSPCQQPDGVTLYDWLNTIQLPSYKMYKFDCSQRAAYIEWLTENCGYHTVFVAKEFDGYAHMWLLIDGYTYETGEYNRWVAPGDWHYVPDDTWESIYNLPYSDEEFGWWLNYPELNPTLF